MHPVTRVISAAVIAGAMITGSAATALADTAEDGSQVCSTFYDERTYNNPDLMGEDCKTKIGGPKYKGSTKSSKSSGSTSKATTNGMWPTLDNAIRSGDRAAIKRAITEKGRSASYHDRVVSKVRQAHPELAQRYGF